MFRALKSVGTLLGHYLRHAAQRTESLLFNFDGTEEFSGSPPDIAPKADAESETAAPNFSKIKVQDIFKKLGPMAIFSARNRWVMI